MHANILNEKLHRRAKAMCWQALSHLSPPSWLNRSWLRWPIRLAPPAEWRGMRLKTLNSRSHRDMVKGRMTASRLSMNVQIMMRNNGQSVNLYANFSYSIHVNKYKKCIYIYVDIILKQIARSANMDAQTCKTFLASISAKHWQSTACFASQWL